MEEEARHNPVMVREVIEYLRPSDGGVYFDGTVGEGGHAGAILEASAPGGRVIGVDLDPEAAKTAAGRLSPWGERARIIHGNYKDIVDILAAEGVSKVDGILLDLGLGSHQLSSAERGFSIDGGGPLDMRYDRGVGLSAKEVVNRFPKRELERIFRELGEERRARAAARGIVNARERGKIENAEQLSRIVVRAVAGGSGGWKKIHPATRVFMALRIYVNKELKNLEEFLPAAMTVLKEGGVIVVISFHSLEDRIVKTAFRRLSGRGDGEGRYGLDGGPGERSVEPLVSILTKKPITPTQDEVRENRRARSAKLRVARRTGHEN